jgi:hypothetical protein
LLTAVSDSPLEQPDAMAHDSDEDHPDDHAEGARSGLSPSSRRSKRASESDYHHLEADPPLAEARPRKTSLEHRSPFERRRGLLLKLKAVLAFERSLRNTSTRPAFDVDVASSSTELQDVSVSTLEHECHVPERHSAPERLSAVAETRARTRTCDSVSSIGSDRTSMGDARPRGSTRHRAVTAGMMRAGHVVAAASERAISGSGSTRRTDVVASADEDAEILRHSKTKISENHVRDKASAHRESAVVCALLAGFELTALIEADLGLATSPGVACDVRAAASTSNASHTAQFSLGVADACTTAWLAACFVCVAALCLTLGMLNVITNTLECAVPLPSLSLHAQRPSQAQCQPTAHRPARQNRAHELGCCVRYTFVLIELRKGAIFGAPTPCCTHGRAAPMPMLHPWPCCTRAAPMAVHPWPMAHTDGWAQWALHRHTRRTRRCTLRRPHDECSRLSNCRVCLRAAWNLQKALQPYRRFSQATFVATIFLFLVSTALLVHIQFGALMPTTVWVATLIFVLGLLTASILMLKMDRGARTFAPPMPHHPCPCPCPQWLTRPADTHG